MKSIFTLLSLSMVLVMGAADPCHAVSVGMTDDFEDGSIGNWSRAFAGGLTNIADGGPMGAGDNFLEIVSNGGGGPGSRFVMFNESQWTGDYESADFSLITADVNNLGNTDLDLRIAFGNVDGTTWYASTNPIPLSAGSGWQNVVFNINDVTQIAGTDDLPTTLSNVSELRILSSVALPTLGGGGARGDVIAATLGIDNITAIPEPATILMAASCSALMLLSRRERK